MLRFLLDANVVIPLEPTSTLGIEAGTAIAADVVRRANELGFALLVHPETIRELATDRDRERRELRQILLNKYGVLTDPPSLAAVESILGEVAPQSNDWVDHHLLAAIHADAVHYLVTNDEGIHKKARWLGIPGDRVLRLTDARALLDTLVDHPQVPPPQVQTRAVHSLNKGDPIFESLRVDYPSSDMHLGFDRWLEKASREGRNAWVIERSNGYAGICIWKPNDDEYGLGGKVMKISTFKVSEEHRGRRYGELLLKAVFSELHANHYDNAWLTVFERHDTLVAMLEDFGFYTLPNMVTDLGELIYVKRLTPTGEQVTDSFAYHQRFGPPRVDLPRSPIYVIPIRPRYHRRLFPDDPHEQMLIPWNEPFSNALRKAYLCQSSILPLPRGSVILFYRSHDRRTVNAIGVVEDAMRSSDPAEITQFAGQRTVYTYQEIEELARQEVLAILFRQDRLLEVPWPLRDLRAASVLKCAPQSITQVHDQEAIQWLSARLTASP